MKSLPLTVRKRVASGKGGARQTRFRGAIPAVFYGEETAPVSLEIDAREFGVILKNSTSEHVLIDLTIEDNGQSTTDMALVKDVQRDPITDDVLHVDFLHIHPTKKIRVTVPVLLNGLPDGVKNFGGILQHVMRTIEVEGLPADLPDIFEIDVSELGIHGAVHVRDLTADRATIVSDPGRTVASVVPPTVVKEVTPDEAEAAEGAEAPAEGDEAASAEGEAGAEKKDEGADEKKK